MGAARSRLGKRMEKVGISGANQLYFTQNGGIQDELHDLITLINILVPMKLATAALARFGWTLVALAHGELQAWLAWIA